MTSIDLNVTYYSIPVSKGHRKYLKFQWRGQLWQFDALPNVIGMAPRKFTKLMKPVFAFLGGKGHISTSFLYDSLLVGASAKQ